MRAFACFPSSSERFSIINNRYTDRTQCFLHLIDAKWLVAHKLRSETSTNLTALSNMWLVAQLVCITQGHMGTAG